MVCGVFCAVVAFLLLFFSFGFGVFGLFGCFFVLLFPEFLGLAVWFWFLDFLLGSLFSCVFLLSLSRLPGFILFRCCELPWFFHGCFFGFSLLYLCFCAIVRLVCFFILVLTAMNALILFCSRFSCNTTFCM